MASNGAKLPNDLIGIAGVHFVAMKLTLRALIALPTVRNTAGIDILVSEPSTRAQAALQVKTSLSRVSIWPTSLPAKCIHGLRSFYVLLRYLAAKQEFEAFLEAGDRVAEQVRKGLEERQKKGQSEFPFWSLPKGDDEIKRVRTQWETWRPRQRSWDPNRGRCSCPAAVRPTMLV